MPTLRLTINQKFGAIIQLCIFLASSQQPDDCNHSPNKIVPTALGPTLSVLPLEVSMR